MLNKAITYNSDGLTLANAMRMQTQKIYLIIGLSIWFLNGQCQITKSTVEARSTALIQKLMTKTPSDLLFADSKDNMCNISFSYLGKVNAKSGNTYYVATLICDWGLSCRRTTRIFIYDSANSYLGNYYTGGILPTSLDKNKLLGQEFIPTDLTNGIPDSIQIDTGMWVKFEN